MSTAKQKIVQALRNKAKVLAREATRLTNLADKIETDTLSPAVSIGHAMRLRTLNGPEYGAAREAAYRIDDRAAAKQS